MCNSCKAKKFKYIGQCEGHFEFVAQRALKESNGKNWHKRKKKQAQL